MYTLYGHEGATSAASFSPSGDHFITGGADSVVLCWKSHMNEHATEDLNEIMTKVETEHFISQKEKVDKLPETRGTKLGKENMSILQNSLYEDPNRINDTSGTVN